MLSTSAFRLAVRRSAACRGIPLPTSALFMQEGERATIETPDGPVLVAKVGKELVACSAICPHMKKPMSDGDIVQGATGPEIVCPIHNSKFCMKTGKCTKWVTGVAGAEIGMVANMARGVGGSKQNIAAYKVVGSNLEKVSYGSE